MTPDAAADLLDAALERRAELLDALPQTDCVRLLHGVNEGWPGVAVDRYGPILLVQTWREPLADGVLKALAARCPWPLLPVWNHRDGGGSPEPTPDEVIGHELGARFDVRPRHRGQDPLLFLDFRVARRWVRANAAGREVLNLFAYTGGIGVAAALGGARRVVNVDFAASALEVAQANAALNDVTVEAIHDDVFPVIRQLAGLPLGGRKGRRPPFVPLEPTTFDLVVLDPPRWARSRWGAVDIARDYPSLFKPAVLATAPGGAVLATNHLPTVALDDWLDVLRRCADKAGRPLGDIQILEPEADFPSRDGAHPLKIAVCAVP